MAFGSYIVSNFNNSKKWKKKLSFSIWQPQIESMQFSPLFLAQVVSFWNKKCELYLMKSSWQKAAQEVNFGPLLTIFMPISWLFLHGTNPLKSAFFPSKKKESSSLKEFIIFKAFKCFVTWNSKALKIQFFPELKCKMNQMKNSKILNNSDTSHWNFTRNTFQVC